MLTNKVGVMPCYSLAGGMRRHTRGIRAVCATHRGNDGSLCTRAGLVLTVPTGLSPPGRACGAVRVCVYVCVCVCVCVFVCVQGCVCLGPVAPSLTCLHVRESARCCLSLIHI